MAELLSLRGGTPINNGLSVPPVQALHDAWDTQAYALGTKFWDGDRCFKYAKAGATVEVEDLAYYNDYQVSGYTVLPAQPVGSGEKDGKKVRITIGSSEGVAADGAIAENELVGGYITIFNLNAGASNTDYTFRITSNIAVASGGAVCDLTIANSLPYAASTSAYSEVTGNYYSDVRASATSGGSNGGRAFLGACQAAATTTYPYHWLQSWGPTFISPQAAVGASAYNNLVIARYDGTVQDAHASSAINGFGGQVIGYVITRAAGGGETQGTPLIFLQISC